MTTTDIEQDIAAQALDSARGLIDQGWTGPSSMYDIGAYPGDVDALEARLGRTASKPERIALELAIRGELAAAAA